MEYNVTMKVNGQDIPMNPFVREVFRRVCGGLVDSLDRLPEKKERIEIVMTPVERTNL